MEKEEEEEEEVVDDDDDKGDNFFLCSMNKISTFKSTSVLPNETNSNISKLCFFYNYVHK
jgi:hypothetical protein